MNNPNVGRGVTEQLTAPQIIRISKWEPRVKNTLRGFFSAIFPSGIIIRKLALHEKNGSRWINPPSRARTEQGQEIYEDLIDFTTKEIRAQFQDDVLAALDAHFGTMTPK